METKEYGFSVEIKIDGKIRIADGEDLDDLDSFLYGAAWCAIETFNKECPGNILRAETSRRVSTPKTHFDP